MPADASAPVVQRISVTAGPESIATDRLIPAVASRPPRGKPTGQPAPPDPGVSRIDMRGDWAHAGAMSEPIVFINMFELAADKVDAFLAGWKKRAEFMAEQPGFLSFRIHRAIVPGTRFQLVNIATWESIEALTTATGNDRFQSMVREAAAEFDAVAYPAVYHVALEV